LLENRLKSPPIDEDSGSVGDSGSVELGGGAPELTNRMEINSRLYGAHGLSSAGNTRKFPKNL
jgi:hypothetical protein